MPREDSSNVPAAMRADSSTQAFTCTGGVIAQECRGVLH